MGMYLGIVGRIVISRQTSFRTLRSAVLEVGKYIEIQEFNVQDKLYGCWKDVQWSCCNESLIIYCQKSTNSEDKHEKLTTF